MENKLFKSWEDSDQETLKLLNHIWNNSGPAVIKLSDVKHKIPYVENQNNKRYRPTVHIGQRKLFMNELQFLNNHIKFINPSQTRHHFVIYAGGSPGHHMYELSRYYPNVTFIVIDPSRHQSYLSDHLIVEENKKPFYRRVIYYEVDNDYMHDLLSISTLGQLLKSTIRIFVIKNYCSQELLTQIKAELPQESKIYLWSDIRTDNAEAGKFGKDVHEFRKYVNKNRTDKFDTTVTDGDILWNLAMQYNWLKTLEPEASMFKFRCPFYTDDLDNLQKFMSNEIGKNDFEQCPELKIIENYKLKNMLYPKGTIYIQPWQGCHLQKVD